MAKEIEITISENGDVSIEGIGLKPNEKIEDIAKFITDELATVTEVGHKHTHKVNEAPTRQRQK